MTAVVNHPRLISSPVQSNRILPIIGDFTAGVFRLPTDPLFYADLVLQNIVSGSRYRVTKDDDGTELATGVASGTEVELTGLAAYANPMLVKITVRKGTSAPKYEPLETYAYMTRGSVSAYIAQVPDPIA